MLPTPPSFSIGFLAHHDSGHLWCMCASKNLSCHTQTISTRPCYMELCAKACRQILAQHACISDSDHV